MQTWRSLVTPWVVQHRRRSFWCLWGPHTLLLYILHICSLSHSEYNYMCNQLWSNHTYLINLLFSFDPLFSLLSLFSLFFIIIIIIHIFAAKCGTYSVMILLYCSRMCLHLFHSILFLLCCFIPLGSKDHLVCDTAFRMQHTKFLGGMCNWWCLGDLWVIFRSPRVTYYISYMFGFNVNTSYLYSVKP